MSYCRRALLSAYGSFSAKSTPSHHSIPRPSSMSISTLSSPKVPTQPVTTPLTPTKLWALSGAVTGSVLVTCWFIKESETVSYSKRNNFMLLLQAKEKMLSEYHKWKILAATHLESVSVRHRKILNNIIRGMHRASQGNDNVLEVIVVNDVESSFLNAFCFAGRKVTLLFTVWLVLFLITLRFGDENGLYRVVPGCWL